MFSQPVNNGIYLGFFPLPSSNHKDSCMFSLRDFQPKNRKPRLQYREEGTNPRYTNQPLSLLKVIFTFYHGNHHFSPPLEEYVCDFFQAPNKQIQDTRPWNFRTNCSSVSTVSGGLSIGHCWYSKPTGPGFFHWQGLVVTSSLKRKKNNELTAPWWFISFPFWDSAYHIFRGESVNC